MARTLDEWLAHCERIHPKEIDMTLDRVRAVYARLQLDFGATPIVSVAGTNGKGSSCAMLESIATHAGWRVGLYIKPHLVNFTERCRIGSADVAAEDLVAHFEAVEQARGDTTLSYFEFTLLAILRCFAQAKLDLVILEVGLGGRLDAVNVVDADVALITSIDLDHMGYLGNTREKIGLEKAHIMRAGRAAVVSDPAAPSTVLDHAQSLGVDLRLAGRDFMFRGDRQQWSWKGRAMAFHGLAYPALRGANQLLNAAGALAVLEVLHERLPVTAQAVRLGFARVVLLGRFQIVPGEPVTVLDVAHNPHAAAALAANLDQMGFYPRTFAVFAAMVDKDLEGVIKPLAPLIDAWLVCDLPTPRAAGVQVLAQQVRAVCGADADVSMHASPSIALRAAIDRTDPTDRIVVFGSFFTVGGVLKEGLPRTGARHGA